VVRRGAPSSALSFDDLHWADQDTLLLFEHVTRTAAGLRWC